MTGRELIIHILENHLENEIIFENGKIKGFLTDSEMAAKMNVGRWTIKVYVERGWLKGIRIGDCYYIPENAKLTKKIKESQS